jgi:hypothetical protein
MLRLSSQISLGDYTFNAVNQVEIESSWEDLTDRCTIKIPKRIRIKKNGLFASSITSGDFSLWKRGDPVTVQLGYNERLETIFTGVITRITPKLPLEFQCEDNMFILKQTTIRRYKENPATLRSLLTAIIPNSIPFTTEDITLGKFSVENATVAEVLDYLKRKFGLSSYIESGSLYVGLAYKPADIAANTLNPTAELTFQKDIIEDSNLSYQRDDDVSLNVTAINVKTNNTRQEITVGDTLGEKRTLYFYDIRTEAELRTLATEALEKYKYEGFRGSFTTFLQPVVRHGQAVKLIDPLIPDRNGVYLVKKVITTFGVDGGRQEITLDRKIS